MKSNNDWGQSGMSFNAWKEAKLGDIAKVTKLAGFEFTKYIKYVDDGEIIAIRALNVKNGTFNLSDIKRINKDVSDSLTRSKLYKDEIVLTYTGAKFGEVAIVKHNNRFHLAPNVAKVSIKEGYDKYFIYSFLRSWKFRQQLINYSVGSSQPTIPMMAIRQLSVPVPTLQEQKSIADTLCCIDEKIELNNSINKTLEEIAHAIFKSWFVDFEPFQNGEFEDGELGSIPKGWRVDSLDNVANYLNGIAMQKYRNETEEFLPVVKIKELNQGFTDNNCDKASVNIPEQYIVKDGDVIFSWSGTLMVKIWTGGIGGLNQHLFKVTSDKFPKWYYYLWTCHHLRQFQAIAKDKATTMGHIKRSHLSESKVLIPNEKDFNSLNDIMKPIIDEIIRVSCQNKNLIQIRDTLLPKLMSGEIMVPSEEV